MPEQLAGTLFSIICVAKTPLEAASDLAEVGDVDPAGLTLMFVSIGIIFIFALTLIVAASIHIFKKKKP